MIFAIEAEQSNFELLRWNVRPYPNIIPIQAALWNIDGSTSIAHPSYDPLGHWAFVVQGDQGDVRSITFPSLMRAYGFDHVDLLKGNIEGAEKEVFEACDWQNCLGSVVIELHDHFKPGCAEAVDRALHGFSRSVSGSLVCYTAEDQANRTAAAR